MSQLLIEHIAKWIIKLMDQGNVEILNGQFILLYLHVISQNIIKLVR